MIYSIDRLTDLYAVCVADSGEQRLIPRSLIDGEPAEGALLHAAGGRFVRDPAAEAARRSELHALAEQLFRGSGKKS